MNDQLLNAIDRLVDPFDDQHGDWEDVLCRFNRIDASRLGVTNIVAPLQSLPDGHRRELEQRPSRHRRLRSGRAVVVFAVVAALLLIGTALAETTNWLTTGWLTGNRAPSSVVSDFDSYAPELGFDPVPGRAVLVAADGTYSLYATINKQGGYCVLASAPWKRPNVNGEGGSCIRPTDAGAPLVAGVVGISGDQGTNEQTLLVAGRTIDPGASSIRFTDPNGNQIVRPIGTSGFFIAGIRTPGSACSNGDWTSAFDALGPNGQQLDHSTITLGEERSPGACVFASGPHP